MIKLRDYQKEAVDLGLEFFKSNSKKRPILVAPTGAGKSLIIADVAHNLRTGVLVLQPSKELLEQNYAKFKMYGGVASVYSASMGSKEISDVTFATIGSVKDKADLFSHVRYVIIDECHLVPPEKENKKKKKKGSMYMKFFEELEDVKVLGLTATPFRLKAYRDRFTLQKYSQINLLTRERPHFFNEFLHISQISELQEKGFLAEISYYSTSWDESALEPNTTGAEYSDPSVERSIMINRVNQSIPAIIAKSIEKGRKHRLVFVKSVEYAEMLVSQVPNSACVHAKTKRKERDYILRQFKMGTIRTVFNVGVLTIGFDFPAIDVIIIARPTKSLVLFMQMVGRGLRTHPGKENCLIVDMCGNVERFGDIRNIVYREDPVEGWIVENGERVLSGVRL